MHRYLARQFFLEGLQAFAAAAGQNQCPAGFGETARGGAAEARGGSGNEGDLAVHAVLSGCSAVSEWPSRKSAPRLGAKARYTRGPLHTCRRQRAVEVTEGTPVEALPALARRTLPADDGAVELALPQVVRR